MTERLERAACVAVAEQILSGRKLRPLIERVARERLGIDLSVDDDIERDFLYALADVLAERGGVAT